MSLLLYLALFAVGAVLSVLLVFPSSLASRRFAVLYWTSWLRARSGSWRAASVPHRVAQALASSAALPLSAELVAWVEGFLHTKKGKLLRVEVAQDSLGGGFMGAMFRLLLTWDEDTDRQDRPHTLVVKTLTPTFTKRLSSVLLGSAREAFFYRNFASDQASLGSAAQRQSIRSVTPKVYFADGSWTTGDYVLVMEDLSRTGARLGSHVLGNQCWGPVKDFPSELQTEEVGVQMFEEVFAAMADVHAAFWRDESLLRHSWLKASDWLQGKQRPRWELAMEGMRKKWNAVLTASKQGKMKVKWSKEVIEAMEDSLAATNWETFQRGFDVKKPTTPFTLCHGDFHAANILWVPGRERAEDEPGYGESKARVGSKVYMVDWPEVGVFCPFTELAQFLVSNATIEVRRKIERRLFKDYHARLISKGVCGETFTLEACWERYQRGGSERWLQMLTLMANIGLEGLIPDRCVTWFHDQVAAFLQDHYYAKDGSHKTVPLMSAYALA